jgi:hypothetical protein
MFIYYFKYEGKTIFLDHAELTCIIKEFKKSLKVPEIAFVIKILNIKKIKI